MTENETLTGGTQPTGSVIDLAAVVNVEAIFGRALLDEVAAVTAELARRKDDLRAFIVRATAVTKACGAAHDAVYPAAGRVPGLEDNLEVHDGLGAVLDAASGMTQLYNLACEVGIEESIDQ